MSPAVRHQSRQSLTCYGTYSVTSDYEPLDPAFATYDVQGVRPPKRVPEDKYPVSDTMIGPGSHAERAHRMAMQGDAAHATPYAILALAPFVNRLADAQRARDS